MNSKTLEDFLDSLSPLELLMNNILMKKMTKDNREVTLSIEEFWDELRNLYDPNISIEEAEKIMREIAKIYANRELKILTHNDS